MVSPDYLNRNRITKEYYFTKNGDLYRCYEEDGTFIGSNKACGRDRIFFSTVSFCIDYINERVRKSQESAIPITDDDF